MLALSSKAASGTDELELGFFGFWGFVSLFVWGCLTSENPCIRACLWRTPVCPFRGFTGYMSILGLGGYRSYSMVSLGLDVITAASIRAELFEVGERHMLPTPTAHV